MSSGNSNWNAIAGGGQQSANASQLSRWIAQLGVCTGAPAAALINPGDVSSLRALAGQGPLAEAGAFRMQGGQPCYLMPLNPSLAGAIGAVSIAGSSNATVAVSAAPHVPIALKCVLGGALGTAQFQVSVNGGNFGPTFTPTVAVPTFAVPGTFCTLTFPSATYVVNTTASIGINGAVTLGTGWVGAVTQTSSPLDYYEIFMSTATPGGFGVGQFLVSPDNGPGPAGGGSTMGAYLIPSTGQIVLPSTGLVLQIGQHVIVVTITTGGVLGTAIFSYTVDGGAAVTGQATTPNSGSNFVFIVPGTGVTLTFPAGTYVLNDTFTDSALGVMSHSGTGVALLTQSWAGLQANDSYAFLTAPPGHSTTDLNNACTALQNTRNFQITGVHLVTMPSSAAGALSALATLDAAMQAAFTNNGLDWQGWCECPSSQGRGGLGDIVVSGGVAVADSADTDAVIVAARGSDTTRTAIHAGSYRMTSALTGWKPARPLGWAASYMFVRLDPVQDLSAVANGPLPIYLPAGANSIGRDESVTPALDAVQFNTARTYNNVLGQVFFTITSSGSGWKNCTTQASWQDARGVRVLNSMIAQLRPVALQLMGSSPLTNPDGTIEEITRRSWSTTLDSTTKRAVGIAPGGPFTQRQASYSSATVLPSSQLGQSPKQLNINYFLQQKGFVSSIQNNVYFSGTLSITPPS